MYLWCFYLDPKKIRYSRRFFLLNLRHVCHVPRRSVAVGGSEKEGRKANGLSKHTRYYYHGYKIHCFIMPLPLARS